VALTTTAYSEFYERTPGFQGDFEGFLAQACPKPAQIVALCHVVCANMVSGPSNGGWFNGRGGGVKGISLERAATASAHFD
jgi:hypothetical protein